MEKTIVIREDIELKSIEQVSGHRNSHILKSGTILERKNDELVITFRNSDGLNKSWGSANCKFNDCKKLWETAAKQIEGIPIVPIYNSILFSTANAGNLYFHQYKCDAYHIATGYEVMQMRDTFISESIGRFTPVDQKLINKPFARMQSLDGSIVIFARIFTLNAVTQNQFLKLKLLLSEVLVTEISIMQSLLAKTTTELSDKLFENPIWERDGEEQKNAISV